MTDPVLATLYPSPGRRVFAVAALGALGVLLIWMAVSTPATPGLRLMLGALGIAVLFVTQMLWRGTGRGLELTAFELREIGGASVVKVADLRAVERGPFAFKPSNGFLLRLETKQPRAWVPGLWWRFGRSVGIGGVTGAQEGKAMAEILQTLIHPAEH